MFGKSCFHTYVDRKINRFSSACFFMVKYELRGEHFMFKEAIGSVLRCFQFYSKCNSEKDWPFDWLTFQGKT